jgi:hypothetical protein
MYPPPLRASGRGRSDLLVPPPPPDPAKRPLLCPRLPPLPAGRGRPVPDPPVPPDRGAGHCPELPRSRLDVLPSAPGRPDTRRTVLLAR